MQHRLESRRLYIADLARRQHEMECGVVAMQPLAYRVLSKRLRQALAGLPEPEARAGFRELPGHLMPQVGEMLDQRHFDQHGRLHGVFGPHCQAAAQRLLARLRHQA